MDTRISTRRWSHVKTNWFSHNRSFIIRHKPPPRSYDQAMRRSANGCCRIIECMISSRVAVSIYKAVPYPPVVINLSSEEHRPTLVSRPNTGSTAKFPKTRISGPDADPGTFTGTDHIRPLSKFSFFLSIKCSFRLKAPWCWAYLINVATADTPPATQFLMYCLWRTFQNWPFRKEFPSRENDL